MNRFAHQIIESMDRWQNWVVERPVVPRVPMSSNLTLKPPRHRVVSGGGGRPPLLRFPGSGGNSGGGRGDDAPDPGERLRRYRMGMAVALVSIVTLFITFSAVFLMRATGTWDPQTGAYVRDWQALQPPFRLLLLNTLLLLASSITVELARRRAAERALLAPLLAIPGIADDRGRPVPWLGLTVVLGLAFLVLQGIAWHILGARGWQMSSGPSSSFFYILTGTHAAHLLGGVLALLYAVAAVPLLHKSAEARSVIVDVAAWYWHVMALLWIYIFALLIYTG